MIYLKKIAHQTIVISRSAVEYIEYDASHALGSETGGIIAGRGHVENGEVIITNASGGGPMATRTASYFSRDTEYCQQLVDTWAMKSNGEIDYLGEWHKHLESNPTPSSKDIGTMTKIATSPEYHVTTPILVIIGSSNHRKSLKAFLVDRKGAFQEVKWKLG